MTQNSIPHLAPYTRPIHVQENTAMFSSRVWPQGTTAWSEQPLENKQLIRHPKTKPDVTRAMHSFGKIYYKSPEHNITCNTIILQFWPKDIWKRPQKYWMEQPSSPPPENLNLSFQILFIKIENLLDKYFPLKKTIKRKFLKISQPCQTNNLQFAICKSTLKNSTSINTKYIKNSK